jgi:hypothetical protein
MAENRSFAGQISTLVVIKRRLSGEAVWKVGRCGAFVVCVSIFLKLWALTGLELRLAEFGGLTAICNNVAEFEGDMRPITLSSPE